MKTWKTPTNVDLFASRIRGLSFLLAEPRRYGMGAVFSRQVRTTPASEMAMPLMKAGS